MYFHISVQEPMILILLSNFIISVQHNLNIIRLLLVRSDTMVNAQRTQLTAVLHGTRSVTTVTTLPLTPPYYTPTQVVLDRDRTILSTQLFFCTPKTCMLHRFFFLHPNLVVELIFWPWKSWQCYVINPLHETASLPLATQTLENGVRLSRNYKSGQFNVPPN